MNMNVEDYKKFIRQFEKRRPDYVDFAEFLDKVLNKASEKFGFLAIVQTRAKSVSSYSSKIIIRNKYTNPLSEMTDLCGARVILHFQSQVDKMCLFIKENFEIDEENSLDQKSKLRVNEFGYRSIHYIVTPKKDTIIGVKVEEKFKTMKAEVQVRTLAEHVWADISHDRIYKTNLIIPDEWRRQAARLSAILEDADIDFGNMSREIDSMTRVYELQYEKNQAKIEIEKLKTLISVFEENKDEASRNVMQLSALYRAKGMYPEASVMLKKWLDKPSNPILNIQLWFEYGLTLSLSKCEEIHSPDYTSGLKAIHHSLDLIEPLPPDLRKEYSEELSVIYYRFGKLLQRNEEESDSMHLYFGRAHDMMPENPLYFVALMESVVMRNIDIGKYSVGLFKKGIEEATVRLEQLLEIGIKRVSAWFAMGRCCFFTGDERKCVESYANAVRTILDDRYYTSSASVLAEISLAGRLKRFNPSLAHQIQLYLNMALLLSNQCQDKSRFKNYLENHKLSPDGFKTPVIIIAGGASAMNTDKVDHYNEYVKELMHGFNGTIISGGTTAGIPGLVGRIKDELAKEKQAAFDLVAYLPKTLPDDAEIYPAYHRHYETASNKFSALDILVCWSDLINHGINPADVILVGIDGGNIATLEYMIALSLGAKVGLVSYSGRAVSEFLQNKIWKNHPNLFALPNDPLTLWALANQTTKTVLTDEEISQLAPLVHEHYRASRLKELKPGTTDINKYKVVMKWEKLDASLQKANLRQVAFYELMLKRMNLGIRKTDKPVLFNVKNNVTRDEYDFLAKLEHARWNAERLLEGWRYGQEKDLDKKLNPYIIAWDKLDEETRKYDYDPVDNIPAMLEKIGYELFKVN